MSRKKITSARPSGSGIHEISLSSLPNELKFTFLKEITGGFSDNQIIGKPGGLGTMYKGILKDGTFAIKRHAETVPHKINQKKRADDIRRIMAHDHENIAKLLAFCLEERKEAYEMVDGKFYTKDAVVESLFCYEYFPEGNLHDHIYGKRDIDWGTRFNIIKGICLGLRYLHMSSGQIIHLNLKPQNILLGKNSVPKITDFMYMRILGDHVTRMSTISMVGSIGYKAPEYVEKNHISTKTDIYALGLIILEVTTKEKHSPCEEYNSARDYIDMVEKTWYNEDSREVAIMKRYKSSWQHSHKEINLCIKIGLKCVNLEADNRPTMVEIVADLDASDDK